MPPKKKKTAFGRSKAAKRKRNERAHEDEYARSQRLNSQKERYYAAGKNDSLARDSSTNDFCKEDVCTVNHSVDAVKPDKKVKVGNHSAVTVTEFSYPKDDIANEIVCIHSEELSTHEKGMQCSNEQVSKCNMYVTKDTDMAKKMKRNRMNITKDTNLIQNVDTVNHSHGATREQPHCFEVINPDILNDDVNSTSVKHSQASRIPYGKRYTFKRKALRAELHNPVVTGENPHMMGDGNCTSEHIPSSLDTNGDAQHASPKLADCLRELETNPSYERTPTDTRLTESKTLKLETKLDPNKKRKGKFLHVTNTVTPQHTEVLSDKVIVDSLVHVEDCYRNANDSDTCIDKSYISRHGVNAHSQDNSCSRMLRPVQENLQHRKGMSTYCTNHVQQDISERMHSLHSLASHSKDDANSIGALETHHMNTEDIIAGIDDGQRDEDVSRDHLRNNNPRAYAGDARPNVRYGRESQCRFYAATDMLNKDRDPRTPQVNVDQSGSTKDCDMEYSGIIKSESISVKCDTVKYKAPKRNRELDRYTKRVKRRRLSRQNEDEYMYRQRVESQREQIAIRRESQADDGMPYTAHTARVDRDPVVQPVETEETVAIQGCGYLDHTRNLPTGKSSAVKQDGSSVIDHAHGSGRNKCSGNPCLCKRKQKVFSVGNSGRDFVDKQRGRSEETHSRRQYTYDPDKCMPRLKPIPISHTAHKSTSQCTNEEVIANDCVEIVRCMDGDSMEPLIGNMSERGRTANMADVNLTDIQRSLSCSNPITTDGKIPRMQSESETKRTNKYRHIATNPAPCEKTLETSHIVGHHADLEPHPGTSKVRVSCEGADSRPGNSSGLQTVGPRGDNQNNHPIEEESSADRIRNIRTNVIRRLKHGDFTYDQFNDNPLMDAGLEFYRQMEQITWSAPCTNCRESGIDLQVGVRSGTCMRCRGVRAKLFGPENDMDPGVAPAVLTNLTPVEKAAISIISPSISIYKGGITSTSSKGHCVSFYQDIQQLAIQLPHTPADLPIIVIKNPNERITDKNFTVRRANIISALEFLQDNSPDYRDIVINHENVELYPEDDILQTLPSVSPTDVNLPNENATACNPESTTFGETTIDMAIASKTVKENIAEVVNNNAPPENNQHGQVNDDPVENDEPNGAPAHPLPWPAREAAPASEFAQGFYSKAFPDLFPYGRGDITKPRLHKNPSILCYFQHLMRLDRRFVRHHCFTFVATNIWRRHMALTLGNVFTKNSADGLTVQQLKESVNAGDDRVLKKLLYFAASIPGTRQHLRYQSDLALSFVDFIRINSNDTQMFNFFQTFSAADNHWDDLHRILPESDAYLTKTVIPAREVSAEGNGDDIIDEPTDFRLRTSALRNNADVVASFFRMRHLTYLNTVVKKLGMEDYIIRYEDQGRGCLHVHDLLLMSNGVSANDLKNAYKRPFPQGGFLNDPIYEAREKVIDFSTKTLGTSAVHPNGDPGQWPGPYGNNVQRPATNCLRERFVDVYEEGRMKQHYERLINRTMLHQCRMGYCLSDKNRDKDGNLICRFDFPEQPIGFDIDYSDSGIEILSATRNVDAPNGARFLEEKLKFLRNHPTLVHHVPELLAIWGANIEGRPVKSYEQVIRYVMKYLMKPEPNSAPFSSICKAVIDSADDNEPAKKSLQKVLMKTVGENDLSKQLCHHLLSGHPIVEFSRTPICVNITTTRKVKRGERNAPASTENMADIYWRRETDTNYRKIQDSYAEGKIDYDPSELTLYQFASRYTKRWELSRDEKFPHITPNFSVIPRKEGKYPDRYMSFLKMILLTHKAGTTFTEVEALSVEDLEATTGDFCDNNESCPRVIREKYNESQMPAFDGDEDDSDDEEGNQDPELLVEPERNRELYEQDDWMEAIGTIVRQVDDVMDNANDYNDQTVHAAAEQVDWNEDREYLNLSEQDLKNIPKWIKEEQQHGIEGINDIGNGASPNTLNEKQLAAFSIIRQHLLLVKRDGVDNVEQLLLNISGGAGSGKSYFLRVIKRFAEEIFERVGCVVAAAPSCTAAYLVDGETLHSLLHLPLDSRTYKAVQGDPLRDLQDRFQNVCILIIDEKSMIGQRVFQMINLRLREARPHSAHLPFGGLSVVLMGDWSQLPPVFDKPLYDGETNCAEGYNLYVLFNDTIVFDVIERQTDNTFKEELGRLSAGTFTIGDWEKWQSRSLQGMSNEQQQEFRRDAIMACALKADMVTHNKEKVLANGYPVAPMEAETNRSDAKKQSADNLCNIPQHIILNKNTVFRLTSNLWTKAGLTNGAVGVVRYIIYAPGIRPPKLPVGIIATFDSYKGRPYLHDLPKSVVISPVRREFRINNVSCFRIHLPIILGYALSIHRLQGNTLDKVIINIGSKEFASGLTYVGASRVRSFAGLSFHPYPNYERFEQISKSTKIKRRMEEEKRLLALQAITMEKYSAALIECAVQYGVAPQ